jgi:hypothetical protein
VESLRSLLLRSSLLWLEAAEAAEVLYDILLSVSVREDMAVLLSVDLLVSSAKASAARLARKRDLNCMVRRFGRLEIWWL